MKVKQHKKNARVAFYERGRRPSLIFGELKWKDCYEDIIVSGPDLMRVRGSIYPKQIEAMAEIPDENKEPQEK